jgi:hypothetical protein
VLENFRTTAEALGADADALLREADVAPEVMTTPGIYLPYANYLKLMDCAALATGTPHFGLEMTRSATTETLGTVGIIMTQAATVGTAWQALADFYGIHDTWGIINLQETDDCAIIEYGIPRRDLPRTSRAMPPSAPISCNLIQTRLRFASISI